MRVELLAKVVGCSKSRSLLSANRSVEAKGLPVKRRRRLVLQADLKVERV